MTRWTSSGSSREESDVKPETSTKSTVTCLRSPSSVDFDVRMRSARYFGVYESGELNRGAADCCAGYPVGWAHVGQNFAVADNCRPQLEQARARGAAHSSQNMAPISFSCWHRGHFIAEPPGSGQGLRHRDDSPGVATESTSGPGDHWPQSHS